MGHSAADSATGYLYQCRYALFTALSRQRDEPGLEVSVETYDDVAFAINGSPVEMMQLKHTRTTRPLTDLAPQFWNTIGIWTERVRNHPEELGRTAMMLVSTAKVPDGSGLSFLRPSADDRDVEKALPLLLGAAEKSDNQDAEWGIKQFVALEQGVQEQILAMVTILDASPSIVDVAVDIRRTLKYSVRPEQMDPFIERLEGWWFNLMCSALSKGKGSEIAVADVDAKVQDLREQFLPTQLPIDYADAEPGTSVMATLEGRPFVEQLRLIRIGPTGIRSAVVAYFRAFEQRSRWAREGLLHDGELSRFGLRLVDGWERQWGFVENSVESEAREEDLVAAGRGVYSWACNHSTPLRAIVEPFLVQGTFHILANRKKVGWHPDFVQRIKLVSDQESTDVDAPLE